MCVCVCAMGLLLGRNMDCIGQVKRYPDTSTEVYQGSNNKVRNESMINEEKLAFCSRFFASKVTSMPRLVQKVSQRATRYNIRAGGTPLLDSRPYGINGAIALQILRKYPLA